MFGYILKVDALQFVAEPFPLKPHHTHPPEQAVPMLRDELCRNKYLIYPQP